MHKHASVYFIAIAFITVCTSCSSTQLVTMTVREPAPVSMPAYIKSVGIINRSVASRQSKVVDAVDKVFSLEGASLDKAGAKGGMEGLSDELVRVGMFDTIRMIPGNLTTVNPSTFPSPLSWDQVQQICSDNHTDALFSLELFDTDSRISYAANPVKINTPLGQMPAVEHQASMITMVKTGWRIYDPSSRNVIDEFACSQQISYVGKGINPVVAANALIGRKEAVSQVGRQTGIRYAQRIIPFNIRVSRDYYVKGSDKFVMAKRKAQTGNWDAAGELWLQETNNATPKLTGRACYNMAILNEINGNLDEAIRWAQKSYEDYNNRLALRYVNILKSRKVSSDILHQQESGGLESLGSTQR